MSETTEPPETPDDLPAREIPQGPRPIQPGRSEDEQRGNTLDQETKEKR